MFCRLKSYGKTEQRVKNTIKITSSNRFADFTFNNGLFFSYYNKISHTNERINPAPDMKPVTKRSSVCLQLCAGARPPGKQGLSKKRSRADHIHIASRRGRNTLINSSNSLHCFLLHTKTPCPREAERFSTSPQPVALSLCSTSCFLAVGGTRRAELESSTCLLSPNCLKLKFICILCRNINKRPQMYLYLYILQEPSKIIHRTKINLL